MIPYSRKKPFSSRYRRYSPSLEGYSPSLVGLVTKSNTTRKRNPHRTKWEQGRQNPTLSRFLTIPQSAGSSFLLCFPLNLAHVGFPCDSTVRSSCLFGRGSMRRFVFNFRFAAFCFSSPFRAGLFSIVRTYQGRSPRSLLRLTALPNDLWGNRSSCYRLYYGSSTRYLWAFWVTGPGCGVGDGRSFLR